MSSDPEVEPFDPDHVSNPRLEPPHVDPVLTLVEAVLSTMRLLGDYTFPDVVKTGVLEQTDAVEPHPVIFLEPFVPHVLLNVVHLSPVIHLPLLDTGCGDRISVVGGRSDNQCPLAARTNEPRLAIARRPVHEEDDLRCRLDGPNGIRFCHSSSFQGRLSGLPAPAAPTL